MWRIVVHDGKSVTETCFGGDFPNAAEQDCNTSAYADLDSCTASKRRRADAIAAQAAAAAGADIYITSAPTCSAWAGRSRTDCCVPNPEKRCRW